jgi:hypothetical protein
MASAIVVLSVFAIIIFLMVFYKRLDDNSIKSKAGTLYDRFKLNSKPALLYNAVFLFRRLLFALTCLYLIDYPFA